MAYFPSSPTIDRLVDLALEEDLGAGDVTTQALIPDDLQGEAHIKAKEKLVIAGLPLAARVFRKLAPEVAFNPQVEDGQEVESGTVLVILTGPVAPILTGERIAINFLQHLSGIATYTKKMVEAVAFLPVALVDTRKTTPGWRMLEKYAVRLGGARNHRGGLFDGVLIKNNHLTAVGSITEAVRRARKSAPHTLKIEVEVSNLEELEEALNIGADVIMLDNMSDQDLAKAADLTLGRALLEASGSMTLERLPQVANTRVNFISVGAITHSAPAVDIHLRLIKTWS